MSKDRKKHDDASQRRILRTLADLGEAIPQGPSAKPDTAPKTEKSITSERKQETSSSRSKNRGIIINAENSIRQSFSGGRTKPVVVQRKRRRVDPHYDSATRLLDEARRTNNDVLDLSTLRNLSRLPTFLATDTFRKVSIKNTYVADVGTLSDFSSLTEFDASGTPLRDFTPISEHRRLRTLTATGSGLVDLVPLSTANNLETLRINKTKVSTLEPIRTLTSMRYLDASDTLIRSIEAVSGWARMDTLRLAKSAVFDLSPLQSLLSLHELDISDTRAEDLGPIARLLELRGLKLSRSNVRDLLPIADLSALAEGAVRNPRHQGLHFDGCPLISDKLRALAEKPNPERTREVLSYLKVLPPEVSSEQDQFDGDNPEAIPSAEAIPRQIRTAISFTPAIAGPLDIVEDEEEDQTDPEQDELYSRMRDQLSSFLEQVPSQERVQVTAHVEEFLKQPSAWGNVRFKKVLWLCGNSLRNVLDQHDAVNADPDPHYAKLPPATAEILRRPVETWNIVVLGSRVLSDLDAQRLGPRERAAVRDELAAARPLLDAAALDRDITTSRAARTIEASMVAADAPAGSIHTRQAQVLARDTSRNLVVQIMRGAYRLGQELQNPDAEEAKAFVKEYKSGIYKKLGEWTLTGAMVAVGTAAVGAGTAAYYYGVPFFEFAVVNSDWLKGYLAVAFDNPVLVRMVDWVVGLNRRIFGRGGSGSRPDM